MGSAACHALCTESNTCQRRFYILNSFSITAFPRFSGIGAGIHSFPGAELDALDLEIVFSPDCKDTVHGTTEQYYLKWRRYQQPTSHRLHCLPLGDTEVGRFSSRGIRLRVLHHPSLFAESGCRWLHPDLYPVPKGLFWTGNHGGHPSIWSQRTFVPVHNDDGAWPALAPCCIPTQFIASPSCPFFSGRTPQWY